MGVHSLAARAVAGGLHESCVRQMRRFSAVARCPICRQDCSDFEPVQAMCQRAGSHLMQGRFAEACSIAVDILDAPQAVLARRWREW